MTKKPSAPKEKKYIVSIDESEHGKAGLLAEIEPDGTIIIRGEKWVPYSQVKDTLKLEVKGKFKRGQLGKGQEK